MERKLHIGGSIRAEGWEVLNPVAAPHVDHVGNANDLSRFADATFSAIYASHVVEHLDYKDELKETLAEWMRVLQPGGRVFISVPDMDVLARLFLEKEFLTLDDRFFVMRMMFGGHVDAYDYHMVGLNQEFLTRYLTEAGYARIRRVDSFGIFRDTSMTEFHGMAISLNMIADKPGGGLGKAISGLFGR